MPLTLLLASTSPARLSTLRSAGIEPLVAIADVDEDTLLAAILDSGNPSSPRDQVLALARAKADDVARRLVAAAARTPDLVLGCDSMLEIDGIVVGKPGTPEVAVERWQQMRGRGGQLHTGHWLVDLRGAVAGAGFTELGRTSTTAVHFADLTDEEIAAYVATGEPLKVAGGFTVDGLGGPYITAIAGDHHGVVGLSLPLLRELLAAVGVPIHQLWSTTVDS